MKRIILLIFISISIAVQAQDPQFSQFWNAPHILNPALVGSDGCFHTHLNRREQWRSAMAKPFILNAVAVDLPLNYYTSKSTKFAIGLMAENSTAGEAVYTRNAFSPTFTVHKTLSKNTVASLGLQAAYVSKTIDNDALYFTSQFDKNVVLDKSIDHGENLVSDGFNYINFKAGLSIETLIDRDMPFSGGVALYNITTPQETMVLSENELSMKMAIHGSIKKALEDNLVAEPMVYAMHQGGSYDVSLGSLVHLYPSTFEEGDVAFIGGLFYRVGNAFFLNGGMKYKQIMVNASYDITASKFTKVNGGRGGFEISLRYVGRCLPKLPDDLKVPCKRF